MAYRELRMYGDRILRKTSKPVEDINKKILTLLDDMKDTLLKHNGVGLAAPQVGILKRIAIIDLRNDEDEQGNVTEVPGAGYYELINPVILETEGEQENSEACLSLPGKSAIVKRPARLTVKALNREGKEYTIESTGMLTVALCHELDHLDGVMYVDKIESGALKDDRDDD